MKIFELINSLDAKEVLRVENHLEQTQNKVLLHFFRLIRNERLPEIQQLKNKNILAHRLMQVVLDVLVLSSANQYLESKILKIIIEAEILYRRNLFSLALKRIKQAEKLLDIYDISHYRLLVNRWENIILKEVPVSAAEDLSTLSQLQQRAKKISSEQIPESIDIRFRTYYNLLLSRYRLENEKFTKYSFKKNLVENIESLQGENKILALNNNAFIHFYSQQYEKAFRLFKQLTDFYESFENPHKMFPNEYFITLNNLMLVSAICGDYDEVEIVKNKIFGFYKNNKAFELQFFMVTESYLLSIYCETNDIDNGRLIAKNIKNKYKKFEESISPAHKFLLLFNMSLIFFLMNDFKQSLYWIMKIMYSSINKKKSVYLSNIYYYAYFLYCINHFELQHFDLLQEQYSSISVTLSKIKEVNRFEQRLLAYLCRGTEQERLLLVQELLNTDLSKEKIIQFINVRDWLLRQHQLLSD